MIRIVDVTINSGDIRVVLERATLRITFPAANRVGLWQLVGWSDTLMATAKAMAMAGRMCKMETQCGLTGYVVLKEWDPFAQTSLWKGIGVLKGLTE